MGERKDNEINNEPSAEMQFLSEVRRLPLAAKYF
jgi:hypothetical protein